ncbi:phosphoribosylanthranilate isomerase [Confluentibacter sediminis]|uniref:phosphoribosylanthranilate isomerase n=1 Tax=Confluentibacter sediminis TaxID=2219045 RepID=UPI001F20A851|nr:phosphoribosylanthranilate isomerase [Confluentibacter sediminis]
MNKEDQNTTKPTPSPSEKARVKLKVCGMKYQDNIEQVAATQPDYLGFIFYNKSVRNFDLEYIPEVSKNIKKTGVFVDAEIDEVIKNIHLHHLHAVQLHGNESTDYCKKLKSYDIEIIKAFSVDYNFNFDDLKPYETVCNYYLFDTKGRLAGGNGYTFDWSLLKNYPSTKPYFLSGGIGIEEIENVLSFLHRQESKYCYALDVNSKFETDPGLKNIELLKEFKDHVITKEEQLK